MVTWRRLFLDIKQIQSDMVSGWRKKTFTGQGSAAGSNGSTDWLLSTKTAWVWHVFPFWLIALTMAELQLRPNQRRAIWSEWGTAMSSIHQNGTVQHCNSPRVKIHHVLMGLWQKWHDKTENPSFRGIDFSRKKAVLDLDPTKPDQKTATGLLCLCVCVRSDSHISALLN